MVPNHSPTISYEPYSECLHSATVRGRFDQRYMSFRRWSKSCKWMDYLDERGRFGWQIRAGRYWRYLPHYIAAGGTARFELLRYVINYLAQSYAHEGMLGTGISLSGMSNATYQVLVDDAEILVSGTNGMLFQTANLEPKTHLLVLKLTSGDDSQILSFGNATIMTSRFVSSTTACNFNTYLHPAAQVSSSPSAIRLIPTRFTSLGTGRQWTHFSMVQSAGRPNSWPASR